MPLEVDEFAPIYAEDNKEFALEYLCMCQTSHIVALVCLPLPHVEQVFAKKRNRVAMSLTVENDKEATTIIDEDTNNSSLEEETKGKFRL